MEDKEFVKMERITLTLKREYIGEDCRMYEIDKPINVRMIKLPGHDLCIDDLRELMKHMDSYVLEMLCTPLTEEESQKLINDLKARQAAGDTISRGAALEACYNGWNKDYREIAQAIKELPPTQPEITDEQAIEHLQSSGWMQNHDKQMYEMGAKEQPQPECVQKAQELSNDSPELDNNIGDLISRQTILDALDEIESEVADGDGFQYEKWRKYFGELPSAQPEIIRCKDCKYNATSKKCLNPNSFFLVPADDDFCSYAERRTDGRTGQQGSGA